jgi:translation initiation factor IF-2
MRRRATSERLRLTPPRVEAPPGLADSLAAMAAAATRDSRRTLRVGRLAAAGVLFGVLVTGGAAVASGVLPVPAPLQPRRAPSHAPAEHPGPSSTTTHQAADDQGSSVAPSDAATTDPSPPVPPPSGATGAVGAVGGQSADGQPPVNADGPSATDHGQPPAPGPGTGQGTGPGTTAGDPADCPGPSDEATAPPEGQDPGQTGDRPPGPATDRPGGRSRPTQGQGSGPGPSATGAGSSATGPGSTAAGGGPVP